MAEGKDGQILLHKDPSSYYYQGFKVRSNNYNCTRMAFKSRRYRVQCLSNQKLLHHSQHAKNQLKSYTHPANFRVSWSKWLNPFLTTPTQKSVKSLLSFLNLQQQTKNQFILSIHSWDTVLESRDQTGYTHLCEFISTSKKSGYFIDLFWRSGWLENPAIWLAENILAHISGTKIFQNMGFVQEHSK